VAENDQQYMITSNRNEAYKLMYVFKQALDSGQFAISFVDTLDIRYSLEYSKKKDTVIVWVLDSLAYSAQRLDVRTEYPETDSTGTISIVVDTISFRYMAPRPARGRQQETTKSLEVKHNLPGRTGLKPGSDVYFTFDTPVKEADTSLLKLFMVVDTTLIPMDYSISRDSISNKKFILRNEFMQDSTYRIVYDRGAFEDIFGSRSDSTGINFTINNTEEYGTLTFRLSGYKGSIILQLFDSNDKMVREDLIELNQTEEVYYPLLEMGEYYAKVIFDLDKNGEWSTGNYEKKLQPEPVSFYPALIEIKVQWDLVQDWELKDLYFKDDQLRKEVKPSGR
jgi:hypothetical protein